ncbi:hypothetical protein [Streptomyces sp. IB2014 016-6]|uniref:hypothetical protein n=1 Tax=Streptomyces sp. IB2014 016-6 TaxID=2517818 RepID=UPI0011CB8833|nr:hypothetical protein [Streptomyces sp. IB2014 016-6]TXL88284.1 hypothetical protein EW053_19435 [Streptomyces sp. IB2014 016-6]
MLLTSRFGNAVAVNTWNTYTWKPALAEADIIPPRAEEAGESVVTLARWLGHSSPAITLGYYAHFMPEAGSKGRTAIDGLLGKRGDRQASRNSPKFSPGPLTGDSRCYPLQRWPWNARLKRWAAWENAERGHCDPLCHALA